MDLFDKQLSLHDILEAEVPQLKVMIEAKEKLIAEKEKIRKRQEEEARLKQAGQASSSAQKFGNNF